MKHLITLSVLVLALLPGAAQANEVADKLGEDYKKAEPVDKLVMLSTAVTDKVFQSWKDRKKAQAEIDAVAAGVVSAGKTSAEKLSLLSKLRKDVAAKIKAATDERRKAKKKPTYIYFLEPNYTWQSAIAMSYIADTAGASPSLDKLDCLKLVRESTSASAHSTLCLSILQDALARDPGYQKADHAGKLEIIRKCALDKKMVSSTGHHALDRAVLADWINVQLKAGKKPVEVLDGVSMFKNRNLICWFTSNWASRLLKAMASVR